MSLLTFLLFAMGCPTSPEKEETAETGPEDTGACAGTTESTTWCGGSPDADGTCPEPASFDVPIDACTIIVCSVDGAGEREDVHDSGGETRAACCYPVTAFTETGCVDGRPLTVEGAVRLADVVARDDWGAGSQSAPVPAELRELLAAEWARAGLVEHASIAAFAKLSLELLGLGAPADLVRDAQRAGADEVRHASDSFALAARFGGAPVGPGPLALEGVRVGVDLVTLARETVLEGCIGETISAALAEASLARTTDPEARRVLARIVADERRHAALAWRIVQWALAVGGADVRRAVDEAFEARPVLTAGPEGLERWGRLGGAEARAVMQAAWREVVRPAARVLAA
jgi:hypothetical protein